MGSSGAAGVSDDTPSAGSKGSTIARSRKFELGFSELGLYYPMPPSQLPVFETIANEVIPALRKSRTPPP